MGQWCQVTRQIRSIAEKTMAENSFSFKWTLGQTRLQWLDKPMLIAEQTWRSFVMIMLTCEIDCPFCCRRVLLHRTIAEITGRLPNAQEITGRLPFAFWMPRILPDQAKFPNQCQKILRHKYATTRKCKNTIICASAIPFVSCRYHYCLWFVITAAMACRQ